MSKTQSRTKTLYSKKMLFYPGYIHPTSETFMIQSGCDVTIAAIDLDEDDFIEFEICRVAAPDFMSCVCPPAQAAPADVVAYSRLEYCGKPVQVSATNPVVVLTAPQEILLRARIYKALETEPYVWMTPSKTGAVNVHLTGLECETKVWVDEGEG